MRGRDRVRNSQRLLICAIMGGWGLAGCGNGGGGSQPLSSGASVKATQTTAGTGGVSTDNASTASASLTANPPVTTTSSGCSLTTYTPNFAAEHDPVTGLLNQLYHWSAFPARVYFVPGGFLTPDLKAQALAGFDWWSTASGISARYQEVASASAANIVVQFEARGATGYGAITEYHSDGSRELLDATITFNMTYLADVASITPVAAHEFGHALGIGGHSTDDGDVMSSSPNVYHLAQLTPRDVNTLKTAYCGLPSDSGGSGGASSTLTRLTKGAGQTISVRCGFGVKP